MGPGRSARRGPATAVALVVAGLLLAGCAAGGEGASSSSGTGATTTTTDPFLAAEQRALTKALASVHLSLPTRAGAPAPALGPDSLGGGLGSRTVLGFVPSWELYQVDAVNFAALSEVAYYALQVERGGTVLESGAGWSALAEGEVAPLVADAHAAGDRALLTFYSGTPSVIEQLARDPVSAGEGLADRAAALIGQYGFDGVDLDLEGDLAGARAGFTRFVGAFSARLRAIDRSWTLVVNTYPEAALDPESLYDVAALAKDANQLFVMAYDMGDLQSPGPTAPLTGAALSDASVLASYVAAVPAREVILGIPFYGYDFTASRPTDPAVTVGTPAAVTYDEVVGAGHAARWDPVSETPYYSFRRGRADHQTWFEDPVSVALKVALADAFGVGGVGAWEVGMVVGQPEMMVALDGGSAPSRPAVAVTG